MVDQMQHQMLHSPPSDFADGRFSYFISAPTSPSRASEFYRDFDDFSAGDQEFAFQVGIGDRDSTTPVSASELFDHGIIRSPLAPVVKHAYNGGGFSPDISAVGTQKSKGRKSFWSNLVAPKKKKHVNPYARITEDRNDSNSERTEHVRGRERDPHQSKSARRVARSLSPVRAPNSPLPAPTPEKSGCRKWRLRNFLLFRSASEGRASDKDPMRKITSFYRRSQQEDQIKGSNSSSRGTAESKNGRRVSAHERHYTVNRAASEDLKKKTFLPYKQGILGRMAVNPTAHHLHSSPDSSLEADHHHLHSVKNCLKL